MGIITKNTIMQKVIGGDAKLDEPCGNYVTKIYPKINSSSPLGRAFCMLEREPLLAIEKCRKNYLNKLLQPSIENNTCFSMWFPNDRY